MSSDELATVGDLVQIIAEDVYTANERDVPAAKNQLDKTLINLIDERIASWIDTLGIKINPVDPNAPNDEALPPPRHSAGSRAAAP
jgi:hypothetical protein